jgi:hypothetical protein
MAFLYTGPLIAAAPCLSGVYSYRSPPLAAVTRSQSAAAARILCGQTFNVLLLLLRL